MATGFSWIPPLALIDAMGGKAIVQKLIEDKYPEIGVDQATLQRVFLKVQHSNYDYRPFLKAKQ
jgi:3-hydroxyacyl-CoA dehydrogenase